MSATALKVTLYEGQDSRPFEPEARLDVLRALLEAGHAVTRSLGGAPDSETLVLGQFPRGAAGGARDVSGLAPSQVLALASEAKEAKNGGPSKHWKPWFPVIDYDRCTNCMQCLSFCLFDVYSVQEGKITVQNQTNCKTDCPACSRVCPEVAILFPKYRSGPINGDEIDPEDLRREAMKVDISALLGGDIYQALRDRSARAKSRFSKERDEDRALKERQKCLVQLQAKLEIPPEVLASLPSPQEIQSRAAAAQARAEAALAENPVSLPGALSESEKSS